MCVCMCVPLPVWHGIYDRGILPVATGRGESDRPGQRRRPTTRSTREEERRGYKRRGEVIREEAIREAVIREEVIREEEKL